MHGCRSRLKERARRLIEELRALRLAYKDPRVPWTVKVFSAVVVGYALSPLDLIPDFIPVLGYLDDLIILPLGIWLALKMIPPEVMAECRQKARTLPAAPKKVRALGVGIVLILWSLLVAGLVVVSLRLTGVC